MLTTPHEESACVLLFAVLPFVLSFATKKKLKKNKRQEKKHDVSGYVKVKASVHVRSFLMKSQCSVMEYVKVAAC